MKVFEFHDEFFEQIVVNERNDDPFQIIIFLGPAIDACPIIMRKSMTNWTDFRMRL